MRVKNLKLITQDPTFLARVITCDESWAHYYDPLTKQESETWQTLDELKNKMIHQQKSTGKVIMLVFFDAKSMIYQYHSDLQVVKRKKRSVTQEYYLQVLKKLKEYISQKRPELKTSWVLH